MNGILHVVRADNCFGSYVSQKFADLLLA